MVNLVKIKIFLTNKIKYFLFRLDYIVTFLTTEES